MKRYALYPGCNPKMAEPELLKSLHAVAAHMEIQLIELDKVSCCGGAHLQDRNPFQSLLLNARNFTFAERLQLDMVTICNTCQYVLSEAHYTLTHEEEVLRQINLRLDSQKRRFQGTSRPRNFLYVLMEDIGRSEIRRHVRRPLTGLKVAPFYGCHLYSPRDIQKEYSGEESPWNPHSLETLIADLGAEPVPFPQKNQCCGFHSSLYQPTTSAKLVDGIFSEAEESGADLIITPCPLCHANLEAFSGRHKTPVLYYQQLMGLAYHLSWKVLGLQHNMSVRARKLAKMLPAVPEHLRVNGG
jgi:succinate dehydrogenase / fumarate reductase, cytochrome b subunit